MSTHLISCIDYVIGLVIFHPEESLFKRIDQMISLGFFIYVFDNSPDDDQHIKTIKNNPSVCYLTAGKNVGIGYSLATLCATAHAHGHQRLLFLDQDTVISAKTLDFINAYPNSLDVEAQRRYVALVFSGRKAANCALEDVQLAISSGSLFNLAALRQIGWHSEKYFVDCVDYELCVRARRSGLKIGLVKNTPDFDHVSEQPDRSIRLFGKQLLVRRYSAARMKDAIGAYLKLIMGTILKNPNDSYILLRSMGIYILGQLISRAIRTK